MRSLSCSWYSSGSGRDNFKTRVLQNFVTPSQCEILTIYRSLRIQIDSTALQQNMLPCRCEANFMRSNMTLTCTDMAVCLWGGGVKQPLKSGGVLFGNVYALLQYHVSSIQFKRYQLRHTTAGHCSCFMKYRSPRQCEPHDSIQEVTMATICYRYDDTHMTPCPDYTYS